MERLNKVIKIAKKAEAGVTIAGLVGLLYFAVKEGVESND